MAAEFLELPLLRGSISDLSLPKTSRFRPVGFVSGPEASPAPSFQVWGVPETSLLTRVLPSPQHRECPEAPEPVQAGGFVEEAAFSPGLSAGGEGARTQNARHWAGNARYTQACVSGKVWGREQHFQERVKKIIKRQRLFGRLF